MPPTGAPTTADQAVLCPTGASAAAHAQLLRDLAEWSVTFTGAWESHVMENVEDGAGLWALTRVEETALKAMSAAHAVMTVPAPHG